ncbi:transmembrane protein 255A [Pelodytes ibericus]
MLTQRTSQSTDIQAADSTGLFTRRKQYCLVSTVTLLIVSIFIFVLSVTATTRTENLSVGAHYAGIILGLGSVIGIIGSSLIENKRQMLAASMIFISFGVIAAFCCSVVDGVLTSRHVDLEAIYEGKCNYFTSADGGDTTQTACQERVHGCSLKVRSNTCYCCWIYYYYCKKLGELDMHYEFIGVNSCQDVIVLYHLLWAVSVLNIIGVIFGITTAVILGRFINMNPTTPATSCPVLTPQPTVQNYSRPQVPSYNTYCHSTPNLPLYTDLQHPSAFAASTPAGLSDDPSMVSDPASNIMMLFYAPPLYSSSDEKPPPYTP